MLFPGRVFPEISRGKITSVISYEFATSNCHLVFCSHLPCNLNDLPSSLLNIFPNIFSSAALFASKTSLLAVLLDST